MVAEAADVPLALARLPRRVEAEVPVLTREVDDALVVFVTPTEWSATQIDGERVGRGISHEWASVGYTFDPSRYLDEVRLAGPRHARCAAAGESVRRFLETSCLQGR